MSSRKKKILLIQVIIFFVAISLLYFPYKNTGDTKLTKKTQDIKVLEKDVPSSNSFENVVYKGIDLNGNRYIVKSLKANFKTKNPEVINMEIMLTTFFFKDGSVLAINGDYGTYNNKSKDMQFRGNVVAVRESVTLPKRSNDYIYADSLDYLSSEGQLTIYGNVITESIEGNIAADNLKIDINAGTVDFSMFNQSKVKVKLKGK